jgi:hypothetical protein
MARLKAAMSSPAAGPRANTARSTLPVTAKPAPKPRTHKRGEKKALAGAIAIIGSLVIVGLVYAYSGMSREPPAPPVVEAAPSPARIARILLPGTGSQCREILFDNDTGYFSLERPVSCDSASSAQAKSFGGGSGNGGFSSFKEAFGRKL